MRCNNIVGQSIESRLREQPDQPVRNRKRLLNHPIAPWELRVGDFRVFCDVKPDENRVSILALGQKKGNVLRLGGEEVKL